MSVYSRIQFCVGYSKPKVELQPLTDLPGSVALTVRADGSQEASVVFSGKRAEVVAFVEQMTKALKDYQEAIVRESVRHDELMGRHTP